MKRIYLIILSFLILLSIGLTGFYVTKKPVPGMSYPSFLDAVEKNQVNTVIFSENSNAFQAEIKSDPDNYYKVPNPKTEDFIEFLLIHDIKVVYGQNDAVSNGLRILLIAGIAVGIIWFVRRGGNYTMISDASKKQNQDSFITLDQVAGNTEAKSMVKEMIDFMKEPEKYSEIGARMPKGLLLYGPPGTGKTLMARAIAGEANVPFFAMSGSDFEQMYVGVGASRIRNLFNKAKKSKKAVIFIDEIDAIGKKRARNASASNDERDQTLNALLTEMSGFHENTGIVVIGATNRLDTLDEALLRPGRFDRQIEIGLPDVNSRKKILTLHGKNKPLSEEVDLEALSKSTVYFSGAMLENLLNEAAISAANENSQLIRQIHIDQAFYTVIAGAPKTDRSYITPQERKITAYHEAGHALVTSLLLPEHYISKVTIIPSVRGAGGFNLSIPKDTMFQTQRQISANIQVLLAGRAAEELIFGENEITTGAGNDIQKASSLIVDYINKFGMDPEMGMFSMDVLESRHDEELINKCRNLMNQLYDNTRDLLKTNLDKLGRIAEELLERESLNGKDIERICA
ncbi:ATP-dependent metallopeptidase FtsH/Yme1/Tma family protein [Clostridium sp. Marseille-P2415]|uniref:ATP-dependent metallopeptidase FtsH/Yme1/Tma family protein n=2 Tax=Clostridium sp. Marseille-P2415 TaxID=1805471 RepID=UPI0009884E2F|nr:AAA family ATPase [Clostridium sp. Marseille-P2415]